MNSGEFQKQTEQMERLVQRVTALADEDARSAALELLQSVMDLHGAVMSRIVEVLSDSGETGRSLLARLAGDPLICGLLVIYGIHPVPLEDRVAGAIEKVRPQIKKQGGDVELIGITDGVVQVKVEGGAEHGCGSSAAALKQAVEQSVLEAAPEVVVVDEGTSASVSGFVPLHKIQPATREEKKYEESAA